MARDEHLEYIAEVLVENYELRRENKRLQKARDHDAKTLRRVLVLLKQARRR